MSKINKRSRKLPALIPEEAAAKKAAAEEAAIEEAAAKYGIGVKVAIRFRLHKVTEEAARVLLNGRTRYVEAKKAGIIRKGRIAVGCPGRPGVER